MREGRSVLSLVGINKRGGEREGEDSDKKNYLLILGKGRNRRFDY